MVDAVGFEGLYKVTEDGQVWSCRLHRFISRYKSNVGYWMAKMENKNGKRVSAIIHRLVAMTYIPNPQNKSDVNHKDGNKDNNHVSNLEWKTHSENAQHAWDTGLQKKRENCDPYYMKWWLWTPEQLEVFERSSYNVHASKTDSYSKEYADYLRNRECELYGELVSSF